jgi:hypothetical protein
MFVEDENLLKLNFKIENNWIYVNWFKDCNSLSKLWICISSNYNCCHCTAKECSLSYCVNVVEFCQFSRHGPFIQPSLSFRQTAMFSCIDAAAWASFSFQILAGKRWIVRKLFLKVWIWQILRFLDNRLTIMSCKYHLHYIASLISTVTRENST